MIIKKILLGLCCGMAAGSTFILAQEEIKNGVIIDRVVCRQSPAHSYALYLPSDYSPDKSWPILYALDPAARGRVPVECFVQAAERYHFIVAGSNDSRNGPWETIYLAAVALRTDTRERFSIDPQQAYVTGFSGGSRAASMFMRFTGQPVAGIIGCGAGLAADLWPIDIRPATYCGLIGIEDFNYLEMLDLEEKLEEKGMAHRFLVFDGPHAWPPPDICRRALGWLACLAMAQGTRPCDENLAQEVFEAELGAARALEASGDLLQAVKDYQALVAAFKDRAEPLGLPSMIDRLKQSLDFKKALQLEQSLKEKESRFVDSYQRFLLSVEQNPPDNQELHKMLSGLGLNALINKAEKDGRPEEKAMARRSLSGLDINAREKGYEYFKKRDARRSILFFEVAARAGSLAPASQRVDYYNLACAYAQAGKAGEALANIRKAVENGLTDLRLLENEEAFQPLRQNPDFQQILKNLKDK